MVVYGAVSRLVYSLCLGGLGFNLLRFLVIGFQLDNLLEFSFFVLLCGALLSAVLFCYWVAILLSGRDE